MNRQKLHSLIDWCAIILFLFCVFGTTTIPFLWDRVFNIAPFIMFGALGLLLLNNVSIPELLRRKDREFFIMAGGVVLSLVNLFLVRSRMGAFFTIADFFLILYLADKLHFDRIQLGVIVSVCFLIWLYWQFINRDIFSSSRFNTNTPPIFMLAFFCVFICYFFGLLSRRGRMPGWGYHVIAVVFVLLLGKRAMDFRCRGVLAALATWVFTYFFLPKHKRTIPLVIGFSLLFAAVYVLLWKTGASTGIIIFGKRFASGRDRIWYEFFRAFVHHPITGIGSDFAVMLPDLPERLRIAHNALLDLLFVHGIPVFLLVLYLMYSQISEMIAVSFGPVRAACLASVYASLAIGTFENIYILSPYNMLFMMIFLMAHTFASRQEVLHEAPNS
ncbi:MAG: O-antigen ligase family protein [Hungatella sp.]|jgi:hypothetical protein|nr:O-antigen ligase family protein [Hungatella sp.]